jgi:hypothetical protein
MSGVLLMPAYALTLSFVRTATTTKFEYLSQRSFLMRQQLFGHEMLTIDCHSISMAARMVHCAYNGGPIIGIETSPRL